MKGTLTTSAAPPSISASVRRARSVRAWLVARGIEGSRLTSKGFGQTHPVDTNGTDEGRRNNCRVEFHIEEATP